MLLTSELKLAAKDMIPCCIVNPESLPDCVKLAAGFFYEKPPTGPVYRLFDGFSTVFVIKDSWPDSCNIIDDYGSKLALRHLPLEFRLAIFALMQLTAEET